MKCARCQAENDEGARFCEDCGARLELVCPRCGEVVGAGKRFCRSCGAALAPEPPSLSSPQAYTPRHLAEKILTSRSSIEGERKPVTVLFCDLANSTALAGRLGPDAMHGLLNRFFELALGEIHRYEGTINQFLGDGFMALFGAPLAHEDHARRAVLAALGLSRAIREQRSLLGAPADAELTVRLGLNTGFVVVGRIGDNLRMDYTAVGDTTHLAARMQQLGEPGDILVTEATARLVTGYVRLEVLEPVAVKGRTEPLTPYKVVALGRRRSPLEGLEERALSRFVGREREVATLQELLAEVEAGRGQVVGIVGEPGVGKSRLLIEFRRSLAGRRVTYLEGRCLSFGNTIPYLPVLDIVRSNYGIVEMDDPAATAEKLRLGLGEVGLEPEAGLPYLLRLFGLADGTDQLAMLSPEAIKARTFETLCQLSLKGSQRRPLIFAVEDLHWIDQTSQDYFAALVEALAGAPILMVGTYRPGYRPPWMDKSYTTQLSLHRLTARDSLSVVRSVLPEERLPDPLAQVILDKAEGNPFFLEELTRAVAEHPSPPGELTVPDTIHGVLMARIDRLAEEPKRVLQTASVFGREFSLRLLAAIWEGPGALEPYLLELRRLEFLHERLGASEPTYAFKHALTQDVAYDSLLLSRRQALHAAAGRAIESLYAERLDDVAERLAHHYGRTEAADKAVEYLIRSADKAALVYANADAVKALEEALRHVDRLPPSAQDRPLIAIVLRLAHSFYFVGRIRDTLDLLLRHQARLESLQDPALAGPYHFWLSHTYSYLSEYERASELARQALEEATRCGDEATSGKAHYMVARIGLGAGHFRQGVEHGSTRNPAPRAGRGLALARSGPLGGGSQSSAPGRVRCCARSVRASACDRRSPRRPSGPDVCGMGQRMGLRDPRRLRYGDRDLSPERGALAGRLQHGGGDRLAGLRLSGEGRRSGSPAPARVGDPADPPVRVHGHRHLVPWVVGGGVASGR